MIVEDRLRLRQTVFGARLAIMTLMIRWSLLFGTAIFLAACSRDTGFQYFTKLDSRQERAVINLRNITFRENNVSRAMLSVIYLNPVEPDLYRRQHYFLVAQYDERGTPLTDYRILLNGAPPAGIALLDANCSIKKLMPLDDPWHDYYELIFSATGDENLTVTFETDPFSKEAVTYRIIR